MYAYTNAYTYTYIRIYIHIHIHSVQNMDVFRIVPRLNAALPLCLLLPITNE